MIKKVLILVGIIFLALIIILAVRYNTTNAKKPTATIKNQSFSIDIAETPRDKEIGLSKYESLPEDHGMLFPFKEAAIHSFWMKDMKFPIDIIFIRDNTIVTIHRNVSTPSGEDTNLPVYMPTTLSNLVLEINAGLSEKYDFKEGDDIVIENLENL